MRGFVAERGKKLLIDHYVSNTGDDIAILMTHTRGVRDSDIHRLAWDAFVTGTKVAKAQGLYGAGQDLLKDAFTGNVHGMGPADAAIEFDERPNEPFLFFAADKTDPGAFNLPLYLAFADPMNTPGLMAFAHPFWDTVRNNTALKAMEMRRQGFFGAAMLPMGELEYTGIMEKLKALEPRFRVRAAESTVHEHRDLRVG